MAAKHTTNGSCPVRQRAASRGLVFGTPVSYANACTFMALVFRHKESGLRDDQVMETSPSARFKKKNLLKILEKNMSFSKKRFKKKPCKKLHWPGIEPGSPAWQASILPLDHQCSWRGSPYSYWRRTLVLFPFLWKRRESVKRNTLSLRRFLECHSSVQWTTIRLLTSSLSKSLVNKIKLNSLSSSQKQLWKQPAHQKATFLKDV